MVADPPYHDFTMQWLYLLRNQRGMTIKNIKLEVKMEAGYSVGVSSSLLESTAHMENTVSGCASCFQRTLFLLLQVRPHCPLRACRAALAIFTPISLIWLIQLHHCTTDHP